MLSNLPNTLLWRIALPTQDDATIAQESPALDKIKATDPVVEAAEDAGLPTEEDFSRERNCAWCGRGGSS